MINTTNKRVELEFNKKRDWKIANKGYREQIGKKNIFCRKQGTTTSPLNWQTNKHMKTLSSNPNEYIILFMVHAFWNSQRCLCKRIELFLLNEWIRRNDEIKLNKCTVYTRVWTPIFFMDYVYDFLCFNRKFNRDSSQHRALNYENLCRCFQGTGEGESKREREKDQFTLYYMRVVASIRKTARNTMLWTTNKILETTIWWWPLTLISSRVCCFTFFLLDCCQCYCYYYSLHLFAHLFGIHMVRFYSIQFNLTYNTIHKYSQSVHKIVLFIRSRRSTLKFMLYF